MTMLPFARGNDVSAILAAGGAGRVKGQAGA